MIYTTSRSWKSLILIYLVDLDVFKNCRFWPIFLTNRYLLHKLTKSWRFCQRPVRVQKPCFRNPIISEQSFTISFVSIGSNFIEICHRQLYKYSFSYSPKSFDWKLRSNRVNSSIFQAEKEYLSNKTVFTLPNAKHDTDFKSEIEKRKERLHCLKNRV